jgi:hypothetical protein
VVSASANEYSCAVHTAHGDQINFGDLTPYLNYALKAWCFECVDYALLKKVYINLLIFEVFQKA